MVGFSDAGGSSMDHTGHSASSTSTPVNGLNGKAAVLNSHGSPDREIQVKTPSLAGTDTAPVITKSAPTGEPLSPDGLNEFPFLSSTPLKPLAPVLEPTNNALRRVETSPNISPTAENHLSFSPIVRRATVEAGDESDAAPRTRRSVQFVRSTTVGEPVHSRQQSTDVHDVEGKANEREREKEREKDRQGSSFMNKLKALTTPMALQGHGRSQSLFGGIGPITFEGLQRAHPTPPIEREGFQFDGHNEDSDADADAEESAGEGPSRPVQRRRKSRRWYDEGAEGAQTAPTTPKQAGHFFPRDSPSATPPQTMSNRPTFMRRGTMSDIPENQRQGYSEDEGRDRLTKESAWSRGLHSARGFSYGGSRRHDPNATTEGGDKRPSNLRKLTSFGGGHTEGTQPSPWRLRSERTSSLSAQKWKSIKNSLKLLGTRAKAERTVDQKKSAELMAELLAGAPAALFLASMFQRDEHGHKRIPILLEQLKVTVTDSEQTEAKEGERHIALRIELEYGSGLTRMKWVIYRSVRDFANLHLKFKLQEKQDSFLNRPSKPKATKKEIKEALSVKTEERISNIDDRTSKVPRFPKSVLPYLRGLRGYGILADEDEEDREDAGMASQGDGEGSGTDHPGRPSRRKSSFHLKRGKSNVGSQDYTTTPQLGSTRQGSFAGNLGASVIASKQSHQERQRKKLETYLKELITYLIFRPDSNRLCKFLELSALGVRLAAEGGYHGKEGLMMIKSTKGVDARKKWTPIPMMQRHWPKWFLVRHSYVVCVDSPEEMNVYDVFLVDSDFSMDSKSSKQGEKKARDIASEARASATGHHQLRLVNSERTVKLLAKNDRQLKQFEDSIRFMIRNTEWAKPNRFQSFAPVRKRIYAQWLVDGRDYMWNVSRAISMARDVIYIHDWWLSPELYMRRPPAISQKWRLDRLLQKKAQEGVKIFVIMYRNINSAIPIDSEYSKYSLLDLHPNIFVQRSPNQIRQNTFFWAHHEKICVIDHTIAFCGGVDLCFGRWDTPQHTVVDDKLTGFELDDKPKDSDHCQLWPGKDYSNPRVQDFFALDKPYEEMYNREVVPRMPWHDIGMQIVGQPARDLTRHFVQRWNYLLRQRKPSRPTPFLLPPPDFNPADIEALGLDGTCEVQILRSATSWSLGTPNRTEHSILNAYVQMIATSEHFVYIENQFYISSCDVLGTRIENTISDALVDRIKRAHMDQEDWRACIVIPLMPGFQNTVDQQEGSSVRLIMTAQYRSICRGDTSIFGRLRAAGIEPEDYIQFYALRSWGEIGPGKALVTEQLYIHAKIMVVDDRVAIIGSANINERSMLGARDSEIAAIVRDTEVLDSFMAGEPYKVGKFPHTLRMRLMREHLGIDTDHVMDDEEMEDDVSNAEDNAFYTDTSTSSTPLQDRVTEKKLTENRYRMEDELIARAEVLHSFNHDTDWTQEDNPNLMSDKRLSTDARVSNVPAHQMDVKGLGPDRMKAVETERPIFSQARDSYVDAKGQEKLVNDVAPESNTTTTTTAPRQSSATFRSRHRSGTTNTKTSAGSNLHEGYAGLPPPRLPRMDTAKLGLPQLSQLPSLPTTDDTDIGGPPLQRTFSRSSASVIAPLLAEMRRPVVTDDCMRDPLSDAFYLDIWHAAAENNTKLFRQVFRCMPDNKVKTWKEYKEYAAFAERFSQAQGLGKSQVRKQQETPGKTGPPGTGHTERFSSIPGNTVKQMEALGEKLSEKMSKDQDHGNAHGNIEAWANDQEKQQQGMEAKSSFSGPVVDEKAAMRTASFSLPADAVVSPINAPTPDRTFTFPPPPPIPDNDTADFASTNAPSARARTVTISEPGREGNNPLNGISTSGSKRSRRRTTTKTSTRAFNHQDDNMLLAKEDARQLIGLVQGHLVVWPYDWLETEENNGGWFYTVDQIAPLEIYI